MNLMIFTLSLLNLFGICCFCEMFFRKRDTRFQMESIAMIWFVGVTDLILIVIALLMILTG